MNATADALNGKKTKIWGRLPVLVNDQLKAGMGMDLNTSSLPNNTTSKQQ